MSRKLSKVLPATILSASMVLGAPTANAMAPIEATKENIRTVITRVFQSFFDKFKTSFSDSVKAINVAPAEGTDAPKAAQDALEAVQKLLSVDTTKVISEAAEAATAEISGIDFWAPLKQMSEVLNKLGELGTKVDGVAKTTDIEGAVKSGVESLAKTADITSALGGVAKATDLSTLANDVGTLKTALNEVKKSVQWAKSGATGNTNVGEAVKALISKVTNLHSELNTVKDSLECGDDVLSERPVGQAVKALTQTLNTVQSELNAVKDSVQWTVRHPDGSDGDVVNVGEAVQVLERSVNGIVIDMANVVKNDALGTLEGKVDDLVTSEDTFNNEFKKMVNPDANAADNAPAFLTVGLLKDLKALANARDNGSRCRILYGMIPKACWWVLVNGAKFAAFACFASGVTSAIEGLKQDVKDFFSGNVTNTELTQ